MKINNEIGHLASPLTASIAVVGHAIPACVTNNTPTGRSNPLMVNRNSCGQGGVSVVKDVDFFSDTDHGPFRAWGICDRTCGTDEISMAIGIMPPHTEGSFHIHNECDTALYIHSGRVIAEWHDADGNVAQSEAAAGEFIYIKRGTSHRPLNPFNACMAYIVSRAVGHAD